MARTGRTRLKDGGKTHTKQYKRIAITYEFKLRVLRSLDTSTMAETVAKFFPQGKVNSKRRQVYAWKKLRSVIERKCAQGARFHQRGRSLGMGSTLSVQAEEQLVRWINELRADGVPMTGLMLKLQVQELYQISGSRLGAFRESWSWRKSFLRRHRLSVRRRTREGQSTPADGELKAEEFSKKVRQRMQELGVSVVYNADQTGVNYEYVPTTTISKRGQKTVWVKCAGKTNERVTVMPLAGSDGSKREPFLVFKTRPSKNAATAHENNVLRHGFGRKLWIDVASLQKDAQIYANSAGWWNSNLSIEFLYFQFGRRSNIHETILLLWDDFSGHWRQDVLIFARLINVELMKVPPGYTYACQPADVAWNKPLKDSIRKHWIEFLLSQVRAAGVGVPFKMKPPSRHDAVSWINNAWASLTTRTITAGFVKAKLLARDTSSMSIQRLLSPSSVVTSATDWSSLVDQLRRSSVQTHSVNEALDIDDEDSRNSADSPDDPGCIGDDEADESDLDDAS